MATYTIIAKDSEGSVGNRVIKKFSGNYINENVKNFYSYSSFNGSERASQIST